MTASTPYAEPFDTPAGGAIAGHTDEALAEMIVERAWNTQRERRRANGLPRWARLSLRALPRVLAIVSIANGLIGLLAVVTPFLRHLLGDATTAPIYAAYAFICPQRPSHTWFIGGEPMAMEQRMVAMYLAFGVAGAIYALWQRGGRRFPLLPTWLAVVAIAPVFIDVALSTVELRPSTGFSRLWTGTLSAVAIVWWAYPRFDRELTSVRERVTQPSSVDRSGSR
jgi:uncharacterized membrane protein